MLDLASLNTAAADDGGIWVEIKHPKTGEPTGIEFRVRSKNCNDVRVKSKRYMNRLQVDADFRTKGKVDLDVAEDHRTEVLVLCTLDWRSYESESEPRVYRAEIPINKNWVPFSASAARDVYENKGWSWLRAQIEAATEDGANFLPKAVPSSTGTLNTSSPSAVRTTPPMPPLAA